MRLKGSLSAKLGVWHGVGQTGLVFSLRWPSVCIFVSTRWRSPRTLAWCTCAKTPEGFILPYSCPGSDHAPLLLPWCQMAQVNTFRQTGRFFALCATFLLRLGVVSCTTGSTIAPATVRVVRVQHGVAVSGTWRHLGRSSSHPFSRPH